MMKIPDISKIDIKDIDVNKIKALLIERKEVAVQVGVGVLSFFMVVSMLSGSQKEIGKFKFQIRTMESKSGAIQNYKKSQDDIDAFLKTVPPPLPEGQIITLVTDLADKNKVKILTFTPNSITEEVKKSYHETSIQFSLQAKDYKSIVRLVSDIEHTKNVLHVKLCQIQSADQTTNQDANEEVDKYLSFRIDVASLEVKK